MNITPSQLNTYFSSIRSQYSPSTYKRKLSSIGKFIEFLQSRGKISESQAKRISRIISLARTRMEQIRTDKTDSSVKGKRYEGTLSRGLENSAEEQIKKKSPSPNFHEVSHGKNSSKLNHLLANVPEKGYRVAFPTLAIFLFFAANVFLLGRLNKSFTEKLDKFETLKNPKSQKEKISTSLTVSASLTDNYKIPYTTQQELTFTLYPTKTAGEALYTTGRCPTTPDVNGYFTTKLGDDCGSPIPYSLFQNYPELYLGISIGLGEELEPRIPIKQIDIVSFPQTPTPSPSPQPTQEILPSPVFIEKESTRSATESAS